MLRCEGQQQPAHHEAPAGFFLLSPIACAHTGVHPIQASGCKGSLSVTEPSIPQHSSVKPRTGHEGQLHGRGLRDDALEVVLVLLILAAALFAACMRHFHEIGLNNADWRRRHTVNEAPMGQVVIVELEML